MGKRTRPEKPLVEEHILPWGRQEVATYQKFTHTGPKKLTGPLRKNRLIGMWPRLDTCLFWLPFPAPEADYIPPAAEDMASLIEHTWESFYRPGTAY